MCGRTRISRHECHSSEVVWFGCVGSFRDWCDGGGFENTGECCLEEGQVVSVGVTEGFQLSGRGASVVAVVLVCH